LCYLFECSHFRNDYIYYDLPRTGYSTTYSRVFVILYYLGRNLAMVHRPQDHHNRIIILLLGFLSFSVVLHIITLEWFHLADPSHFHIYKNEDIVAPYRSEEGKPILRSYEDILKAAGVEITDEIQSSLPPLSDLEDMYGSEPVIIGLEKCSEFRSKYGPNEAFMGPAGMFNTGTNLLERLMVNNCHIPGRDRTTRLLNGGHLVKYQVPWGKHSPVNMRTKHVAADAVGFDQEAFLPGLVIKDPYTWMDSMCRHKYAARWVDFKDHCPNLVPTNNEEKEKIHGEESVTIDVRYPYGVTHHTSMVDLWNTYYGDWINSDFPKVIVRFEDLLLHAEAVVEKICDCVGGTMEPNNGGFVIPGPFKYEQESAKTKGGKAHAGSNGLVSSLVKYGTMSNRIKSFKPEDLEYARKELNKDIMAMFKYTDPR